MRKKLIYVAPGKSSFILQDIEWLNDEFEVHPFFFLIKNKANVPFALIVLFFKLFFTKRAPLLISFGGYHSLIATLVGKIKGEKSYIILNGTDSVGVDEWDYGHLRKGLLKWCCKKSYEWCSGLLPVSSSLIDTYNSYVFSPPRRLGISAINDWRKTPYQVIYNGFDTDFWCIDEQAERKLNTFITVISSTNRIYHKGVDLILEMAQAFPDREFRIVGIKEISGAPPNVKFYGFLNKKELRQVYQSSGYYLQLSVWEGFGCALCEAMLCGCIPIVSEVNMLPEIIQDAGFVLNQRNLALLKELFLNLQISSADRCRELITTRFSIQKRIEMIVSVIKNGI